MDLLKLFVRSSLGQKLFAEDLQNRSKERTAVIGRISQYQKEMAGLSIKPITEAAKRVKDAENALAGAKEAYCQAVHADNQNRQTLERQIKLERAKLNASTPMVINAALDRLNELLNGKVVNSLASDAAQSIRGELIALRMCPDDKTLLDRVAMLEQRITTEVI